MGHISEDTLELYVLGSLHEPSLAEVEEHLLLCAECRDRTRQLDTLRAALRTAAAAPRQSDGRRGRGSTRIRSRHPPGSSLEAGEY